MQPYVSIILKKNNQILDDTKIWIVAYTRLWQNVIKLFITILLFI